MKLFFLILIFEIGFGLSFNLIGSISISEIFLLIFAIKSISNGYLLRYKEFKTIFFLYILLLVFQGISELIVGNGVNNSLKGIAITIVSFCHFSFLSYLFLKYGRGIVVWIILGFVLRSLIFGASLNGDAESALAGEDAAYLKFFLAPLLVNIILFVCLVYKFKNIELVLVITGIFLVVAGARSYGMITFVTGLISKIFSEKTITNKNLIAYSVSIVAIGYIVYVIYVNNVLSGNISSGNNEQLLIADNPYNPIYLLLAGRSEVFVGWMAFMDAPLFGHGSWASDVGYHYLSIVSLLHDKTFDLDGFSGVNVIPTHSVLIGYGTFNGIFAFLTLLILMSTIFKQAFYSLRQFDSYKIIFVFFVIQLFWNLMFSPLSHFRQTLPVYMSFIFVTYLMNKNRSKLSYN